MGARTRHRKKFLAANPVCAFCGGVALATTIEHCPPRAMFQDRQWPEGFEFPACEACNHDSGDDDLVVSMLARMDLFEDKGNRDGKLEGLMLAANRQRPGLLAKMMPSAIEARRNNRRFGIIPDLGQTHQEAGGLKLPNEIHVSVCSLAQKLAKGIYYRETRKVFSQSGCLLLNWFTNSDLLRDGKYVVFDLLKEIGGNSPPVQRTGVFLNDQFEYKVSLSPDADIVVLQARFGNAFGFVVFGCTIPGRLEGMISRLRERNSRDGPFAVLQSTTLI